MQCDKTINTTISVHLTSIFESSDGYFLFGVVLPSCLGANPLVVTKIDKEGNTLWNKIYGGTGTDNYHCGIGSVLPLSDGFIVGGRVSPDNSFGKNPVALYLGWLLRLDFNGSMIWDKTYSHEDYNVYAHSYFKNEKGGYTFLADLINNDSHENMGIWIVNLDETGNILSQTTVKGDHITAYAIKTDDGGFITYKDISGIWLVKFRENP